MNKGIQTKTSILDQGLILTGELSLDKISIGALAVSTGMSKSGLFAHFKSKENLQLAILGHAAEVFSQQVVIPALKTTRGIPRIMALVNNWTTWSKGLTGGCVFSASGIEFNERPGKIRDLLVEQQQEWLAVLARVAQSAIDEKELKPETNPEQFAFELQSLMMGMNYYRLLLQDEPMETRKNQAVKSLLLNYVVSEAYLDEYFKG